MPSSPHTSEVAPLLPGAVMPINSRSSSSRCSSSSVARRFLPSPRRRCLRFSISSSSSTIKPSRTYRSDCMSAHNSASRSSNLDSRRAEPPRRLHLHRPRHSSHCNDCSFWRPRGLHRHSRPCPHHSHRHPSRPRLRPGRGDSLRLVGERATPSG